MQNMLVGTLPKGHSYRRERLINLMIKFSFLDFEINAEKMKKTLGKNFQKLQFSMQKLKIFLKMLKYVQNM